MSDKPLDCVGNASGLGKHDFKLHENKEQHLAAILNDPKTVEAVAKEIYRVSPVYTKNKVPVPYDKCTLVYRNCIKEEAQAALDAIKKLVGCDG